MPTPLQSWHRSCWRHVDPGLVKLGGDGQDVRAGGAAVRALGPLARLHYVYFTAPASMPRTK
jgi:hypothetical protein